MCETDVVPRVGMIPLCMWPNQVQQLMRLQNLVISETMPSLRSRCCLPAQLRPLLAAQFESRLGLVRARAVAC